MQASNTPYLNTQNWMPIQGGTAMCGTTTIITITTPFRG